MNSFYNPDGFILVFNSLAIKCFGSDQIGVVVFCLDLGTVADDSVAQHAAVVAMPYFFIHHSVPFCFEYCFLLKNIQRNMSYTEE